MLYKKGLTIKQIATQRGIKETTVWEHFTKLVEYHQLQLKEVLPNWKIKKILKVIKNPQDRLKEIKGRLKDNNIEYCEISCVLAAVKGKHRKKSITYFTDWYQRTNCFRKCHFNKQQRSICRVKFQQLTAKNLEIEFTKNEFLDFFHNHVSICVLPDKEKRKFVPWQEFQKKILNRF